VLICSFECSKCTYIRTEGVGGGHPFSVWTLFKWSLISFRKTLRGGQVSPLYRALVSGRAHRRGEECLGVGRRDLVAGERGEWGGAVEGPPGREGWGGAGRPLNKRWGRQAPPTASHDCHNTRLPSATAAAASVAATLATRMSAREMGGGVWGTNKVWVFLFGPFCF
jgi:hypothetical protein